MDADITLETLLASDGVEETTQYRLKEITKLKDGSMIVTRGTAPNREYFRLVPLKSKIFVEIEGEDIDITE